MKNTLITKLKQKSMEEGVTEHEHYLAPAPPSKGKNFAINQHLDINVVAVVRGMTPHDMKVEQIRGELTLEQLVD